MKKKLAVICSLLLACGSITSLGLSAEEYALGDVNEDNIVNASDAARVLVASANIGSGQDSGLTDAQFNRADYNQDGNVNALDASKILVYSAEVGAGLTENSDSSVEETQQDDNSNNEYGQGQHFFTRDDYNPDDWADAEVITLPTGGTWDGNFY